MGKLKINRPFTYKAYALEEGVEYTSTRHIGDLMAKSECHYYTEKAILDHLQANPGDTKVYLIYQVTQDPDAYDHEDRLIESIRIKDGRINIILD